MIKIRRSIHKAHIWTDFYFRFGEILQLLSLKYTSYSMYKIGIPPRWTVWTLFQCFSFIRSSASTYLFYSQPPASHSFALFTHPLAAALPPYLHSLFTLYYSLPRVLTPSLLALPRLIKFQSILLPVTILLNKPVFCIMCFSCVCVCVCVCLHVCVCTRGWCSYSSSKHQCI